MAHTSKLPFTKDFLMIEFIGITLFLLVLIVSIGLHELGHLLAARMVGVEAQKFSIGIGKEIAGYTDSRGTRWSVAPIPLGGYVTMEDIDKAHPLKSIFVSLAGPIANIVIAFFCVLLLVINQSPEVSILSCIHHTFMVINDLVSLTVESIAGYFTGSTPIDSLGGMIGAANNSIELVPEGWFKYVLFVALLNISIGIFNLLPIPPLDGHRITLSIIELIIRRKTPPAVAVGMAVVGGVLILGVLSIGAYNDVSRIMAG